VKGNYKLLVGAPLLVLVVFGISAWLYSRNNSDKIVEKMKNDNLVRDYSHRKGNENAKVLVVEFFDPECESCAAFHPAVQKIIADYQDKILFVARYMLYHQNSQSAALALEAAAKQGKFWEMQGILFIRHQEWSHKQTFPAELFTQYAQNLGLDMHEFQKSFDDVTFKQNIAQDVADANILGVKGTPTFFINGRPLLNLSYQDLKQAIEAALNADI